MRSATAGGTRSTAEQKGPKAMHRSSDNPSPVKDHATAMPALVFNGADYQRFVCDGDLTEAQQRELLETLWTIVVNFVDLGFRIHPIQQVGNDKALSPVSTGMLGSSPLTDNHSTGLVDRFAERSSGGKTDLCS